MKITDGSPLAARNAGWPRPVGHDPYYNVPSFHQRSVNAVDFRGLPLRAIHRTPESGLPPVPWYVNLKRSDVLRVVLTGYVERSRFSLPKFDRVRTSVSSDDAYVAIGDPVLELNDEIGLGWYVGTASAPLDEHLVTVINRVARQVQASRILLIGGSGGGFAALRLGALLENAYVYVFSPQTAISRYHRRHTVTMLQTAFPNLGGDTERFAKAYPLLNDAALLYEETGASTPIYYFQNANDPFHLQHHFEPFIARLRKLEANGRRPLASIRPIVVNSVEGHGAPTPAEFEEHLAAAKDYFWGELGGETSDL